MLVQFMCKNILSFKEEAILDMSAVAAYKEHCDNLIDLGVGEKYLKVLSIYGANASGKSNLIIAFMRFQDIIEESFDSVSEDKAPAIKRYYQPFEFTKEKENIEFEIIFIMNQYEYQYGFEYNDMEIVNEWLYRKSRDTKRVSTIYERNKEKIRFGPIARKEGEKYGVLIPKDALILSGFSKFNIKTTIFKDVYDEITSVLATDSSGFETTKFLEGALPKIIDKKEKKKELLEFLGAIDTDIVDITYDKDGEDIEFNTFHVDEEGNKYSIPLRHESQGTIKGINIYISAISAIWLNRTMIIDELNARLHPLLLKFIVNLFYTKTSSAQLIYTTHDMTLMRKEFFRRDQICFVQKNKFGKSELNALSDYKARNDSSFEKDYLAGVYGGIPILKDFRVGEDD